MKIARTLAAALATMATAAVTLLTAGTASAAYPEVQPFGSQEQLVNAGGAIVSGYTLRDFHPSNDIIPYPVQGQLWEATATVTSIKGNTKPVISDFNAVAPNGKSYRVLFGVPTDQGLPPTTVPQGASNTGKLYFDVIGAKPDSVVYNNGVRDLLIWKG